MLPAQDGAGDAVERAADGNAWQQELCLRLGERTLSLEVFSVPFARPASGFALVLLRPPSDAARPEAEAYFSALVARWS